MTTDAASQPSSAIHRRLFIVGCPRAGTELVRRHLSSCPDVHVFPETGLFLRNSAGGPVRARAPWLTAAGGHERRAFDRIVSAADGDGPAEQTTAPRRRLRVRPSLLSAVATLDRIALTAGRHNWLERTPRHFLQARAIERLVPGARVVHVIRDGRDVVASMCDLACRHPRHFGRQRNPRVGIREWNRAIDMHARCLGRDGHVFVLYEDLVARPERELMRIARECGLTVPPRAATEDGAPPAGAPGMGVRARSKFLKLFDPGQRRRIEHGLHLDRYGRLAEALRRRRSSAAESAAHALMPTGTEPGHLPE